MACVGSAAGGTEPVPTVPPEVEVGVAAILVARGGGEDGTARALDGADGSLRCDVESDGVAGRTVELVATGRCTKG